MHFSFFVRTFVRWINKYIYIHIYTHTHIYIYIYIYKHWVIYCWFLAILICRNNIWRRPKTSLQCLPQVVFTFYSSSIGHICSCETSIVRTSWTINNFGRRFRGCNQYKVLIDFHNEIIFYIILALSWNFAIIIFSVWYDSWLLWVDGSKNLGSWQWTY